MKQEMKIKIRIQKGIEISKSGNKRRIYFGRFTPTDDSGLILQELKNKKDGKGQCFDLSLGNSVIIGDETTPKNSSLSDRTDKDKKPKGYKF